jgi:hypothetical protein
VVVGNVGTIQCDSWLEAQKTYAEYVRQSQEVGGCRAYGESVALFRDGDIIREHYGHLSASADL